MMVRKILVLFAAVCLATNAFAVSSVKKLGKNTGLSVQKPVVAEKNTSGNIQNKVITAKSATTPTIKTTTKNDSTRLPAITVGKSLNVVKTPTKQTTNTTPANQPVTPGVSEQEFNTIIQRIEVLESQNAINGVVESGTGNYVTNVAVDGNKLNVTKTQLLHAPVRSANSDAVTGDAEIWIVK